MNWADIISQGLTALLVGIGGGGAGWIFARRQNKAETAKTLAEAALTQANAEKVQLSTRVEQVVSEEISTVLVVLKEHRAVLDEHTKAVERLESDVKDVRHEVTTNHGSSIKDAVTRLEVGQAGFATQLNVLDGGRITNQAAIQALQSQMARIEDKLGPMAEDYQRALADHIGIEQRLKTLEK